MLSVAVDLDGVLAEYRGDWRSAEIGKPLPQAEALLAAIKAKGYGVIVHTSRQGDVRGWLERWGLLRYVDEIDQTKPVALAYIDDRAVRFFGVETPTDVLEAAELPPWWEKRHDWRPQAAALAPGETVAVAEVRYVCARCGAAMEERGTASAPV